MQAWKDQAMNVSISKLHQDISASLTSLGIAHQNEYLTEDQYYSIDIAILKGDQCPSNVALEVDGPFHFASNTRAPLGESFCNHPSLLFNKPEGKMIVEKVRLSSWHHMTSCNNMWFWPHTIRIWLSNLQSSDLWALIHRVSRASLERENRLLSNLYYKV